MLVPPGSVVAAEWAASAEAQRDFRAVLPRRPRKPFGLLERPGLAGRAGAAVAVAGYKVFVSGRAGVGKTALVASLGGQPVPAAHHETTGIQTTTVYWPAKLRESGRPLLFRFSFWDCGETVLKKFDHILPACTEKADGFLFLFSFTDRASFDDLPSQISRVTQGAKEAVKIIIGTKFDQFAHTDVTERDVAVFCHTWGLPVLRAKSISPPDGRTGLSDVAPLLNGLAEHLWRQDQWAAGLLPLSPGSRDPAPPAPAGGSASCS